ncbi:PTS sugar transporter subunit IIC [Coprobacillus sp. OM08-19]|nr:PTS sugar transporter subunit IIC [Coprobacillus sp. AF37-2]RGG07786.1 PTS sugar transporter subunit IIC [Coprobacillus sp. AF27-24BH]RGH53102.1 PTS sugar transporter subunit IIC [Coprobacillus sp. AM37-9BH]RGI23874.1 PTS sugar transporter subunit IIC [Coprobacillus sp. OM08-19]RHN87778.1 PTS sugar transporter subunit IIC [Coprobacillus sp. AM23-2]RHQ22006.1 PTS sugar transporter subunit IIC [Coprobacillus sp. AF29-3BH]
MKMKDKLQNVLLSISSKVETNKYLGSIKEAFTMFVPFIIVGSFGSMLNILVSGANGLAQWVPWLSNLSPAFTAINFVTISCMSLPIAFLIGYKLAEKENLPQLESGLIGLLSYLAVCPNTISTVVEGLKDPVVVNGLGAGVIGAQGLFVSMIMSMVAVKFFGLLTNIDAIKIKMPDSVPTGIARSFNILIPIFIIITAFSVGGCLFNTFTGNYLNVWIYNIIQLPLQALANTTGGILVLALANQLFWFLGIHGGMVIEGVRGPLSAAGLAENISAVQAGGVATNILTRGFWTSFVVVGGGGITLSLLIAIFIFSKREDHKSIAKFSLIPGICGINEPVVFGLPLVLNPIFAIPFILNSVIAAFIAVVATNIGFLTCGVLDCPPGLPVFVTGFISYGIHGIIVQAIILIVTFIIWVPFVLMSNKQAKLEQK